jgi:lipopolysaccharide transport system permease protein
MLFTTVKKDLKSRYKGSALGFLWTFLNPLLMLIVYSVVFSYFLRVDIPNYNYTLFLFIGLVPWTAFSATLQLSTNIILSNSNLIKKIYFPRIILPVSMTVTNVINMLLSFVIVLVVTIVFNHRLSIYICLLPVIFLYNLFYQLLSL